MAMLALLTSTALCALLLLASCAASPNPHLGAANAEGIMAGVWLGLWHGAIAPVTFVLSLFKPDVSMYEVHNNGGWYNFGFLFGIMLWGGSSHGARMARAPASQRPAP